MSALPEVAPMKLIQIPAPFDDPEFLFEVKFDGFRALAYVQDGTCELVSRKGRVYLGSVQEGPSDATSRRSSRRGTGTLTRGQCVPRSQCRPSREHQPGVRLLGPAPGGRIFGNEELSRARALDGSGGNQPCAASAPSRLLWRC